MTINELEIARMMVKELEAQLSSKDKECDELKRINSEYKQLLDPILDWGQDEGHEHRLKLGESITKTVLNRAKEYNTLRAENERLKDQIKETELTNNRYFTNLRRMCADKEIELRKRCEDLEATLTAIANEYIYDDDDLKRHLRSLIDQMRLRASNKLKLLSQ